MFYSPFSFPKLKTKTWSLGFRKSPQNYPVAIILSSSNTGDDNHSITVLPAQHSAVPPVLCIPSCVLCHSVTLCFCWCLNYKPRKKLIFSETWPKISESWSWSQEESLIYNTPGFHSFHSFECSDMILTALAIIRQLYFKKSWLEYLHSCVGVIGWCISSVPLVVLDLLQAHRGQRLWLVKNPAFFITHSSETLVSGLHLWGWGVLPSPPSQDLLAHPLAAPVSLMTNRKEIK